jgi:putative acetyltransferase
MNSRVGLILVKKNCPLFHSFLTTQFEDMIPMYPKVKDPALVGAYPAAVKAGGGYVWDDVLEYRVWCHPEKGAPDLNAGKDHFYPFDDYDEALDLAGKTKGAEAPLALVLQAEYIDEPEPGRYEHVREERLDSRNGPLIF